MKNMKKCTTNPLHSFLILVIAVVIGMILGFVFYLLQPFFPPFVSDFVSEILEIFPLWIGIASLVIPLMTGLVAVNENKNEKGLFKIVAKHFAFAIVCVSFSLIVAVMVSAELYCTHTACSNSEFAGLEIFYVFTWIPWMTVISAMLTLVGIGIFLIVQRKVRI